jgi:hypothetical protein
VVFFFFFFYFTRFKPDRPELAEGAVCPCGRPLEPNHSPRCEALQGLPRPTMWGVGKAWAQQIEENYDKQECLLDWYTEERKEWEQEQEQERE